jgi:predicted ATPase
MSYLALVLWPLGEIDRSCRIAEEAVAQALGKSPLVKAFALALKTILDGLRGDHTRIAQQAEALLTLAHEHGLSLYVAAATYQNGLAKWYADDRSGGLAEMRRGWALLHENGCYVWRPLLGMQLAEAGAQVGQLETALTNISELILWAEETGQRQFDAELHRSRAELLLMGESPDIPAVEDGFKKAIEISRMQHTKTFELRAALGLARLYITLNRASVARELLAAALAHFDKDQAKALPEVDAAEGLLNVCEDRCGTGTAADPRNPDPSGATSP